MEMCFHVIHTHVFSNNRRLQADIVQGTKNYTRMRREVAVLENCIAKEKCMINAIVVQIKHPINVHRWRLLEVTQPRLIFCLGWHPYITKLSG